MGTTEPGEGSGNASRDFRALEGGRARNLGSLLGAGCNGYRVYAGNSVVSVQHEAYSDWQSYWGDWLCQANVGPGMYG